ncbi:hypothetical protein [Paraliobacillus sediminis]|uniref:hypothetical protein n=1 Tax=Paraliobacillus sediminis TaxID=1885916 RepID=UPI000E3D6D01|nr:hypothetical protein [Paraliobacillus sediminis]
MVKYYKSNLKQVKQQMEQANEVMMEAVGLAARGFTKAVTPVGQYDDGRIGGSLRSSIDYKSDKTGVYIGSQLTNEEYPVYVHQGTSRMSANPYLHNGIMQNLSKLKKIAEGSYKI